MNAIFNDREVTIYGDGSQKRCFCYINDTVNGTILAIERERALGQILNIGNDKTEISILELAELIKKLSGKPGELKARFISHQKDFGRFEDVQRRIPDLTKAREVLGFEPMVDNEEGHRRTIEWFIKKGKLKL